MNSDAAELYARAKTLIPGGTQLLSKRPERFLPEGWPTYYTRAKGNRVWDLNGRELIDMTYSGIGACALGYAHPEVDAAVTAAIRLGNMSTLNCPEEIALAERLCALHPWARMARFARSGGEAMAIAVRTARCATGRDLVACCGYHGWHDWYLSANHAPGDPLATHLLPGLSPRGVPRALRDTVLPFDFNDAPALAAIADRHRGELAAIIIEPTRHVLPTAEFVAALQAARASTGAALIVDEITAGFRLTTGGAHLVLGLAPDVAVFAKALSNGYPMAAVIGTAEVLQAAADTFISSTYWTERIGPVAALATIAVHEREDVAAHLIRSGAAVKEIWQAAAQAAGLPITISGIDPLAHFDFQGPRAETLRISFTRQMLALGYLASNVFYASHAHADEDLARFGEHVAVVFRRLAENEA
ncbi:MAG: aminotransferase class III-fold pyridoxal phosphate-dependent enzyme [Candidatus Schekmanbacteria bacterium]|nr:aminotransferase class III-fold pyridoxal phosphate-dependent enzyme [Candidatus Schekmanbacteria bacterium]